MIISSPGEKEDINVNFHPKKIVNAFIRHYLSDTIVVIIFKDGWLYELNIDRDPWLKRIVKRAHDTESECRDKFAQDMIDYYVTTHVKLNCDSVTCAVFVNDKVVISDKKTNDITVYDDQYILQSRFCTGGYTEAIIVLSFPDNIFGSLMPRAVALTSTNIIRFVGGKTDQKVCIRRSVLEGIKAIAFHCSEPLAYVATFDGKLAIVDLSRYCVRIELPLLIPGRKTSLGIRWHYIKKLVNKQ